MKKLVSLLLCLLAAAALAGPACADVIWEPNDDFYLEHYDECVLTHYEDYHASEDTVLWVSPVERREAGVIPAGEVVGVTVKWTDDRGHQWGYVELWQDDDTTAGWIDMTEPDEPPAPRSQTRGVLIAAGVLALGAAAVLLWPRKKDKNG